MKTAIIQRKFDDLGRIFIPAEFRKELGIFNHLNVQVLVSEPDDDRIIALETGSSHPNAAIQDVLGYLILPQTYRAKHNLSHCMMDIWVEEGKIKLRKTVAQCVVTGDTENLVQYRDTNIYLSKAVIKELCELNKP